MNVIYIFILFFIAVPFQGGAEGREVVEEADGLQLVRRHGIGVDRGQRHHVGGQKAKCSLGDIEAQQEKVSKETS